MDWLTGVDWEAMFVLETPILEIILRGSITYLSLFLLLRVILKREAGTVGISDLLVVVLLADASQNAMAGDYRSIPDGILLVLTIILWDYALNWLGFRFPPIQRLLRPRPLLLIKDGQIQWRNLRKEFITQDELLSLIREQGVEDVKEVKAAYMEGDGRISVIPKEGKSQGVRESQAR